MKLPNNLGAGELRSEEADVVGLEVGLPSRWEIVGLGLGVGLPNIWEIMAQTLGSDEDEKNHQSPG